VYVAGREGKKAVLWKNGVATYLTDGDNPPLKPGNYIQPDSANSVHVSGGDVYVAGNKYRDAMLWGKDSAWNLDAPRWAKDSYAVCTYANGGDVYVSAFGDAFTGVVPGSGLPDNYLAGPFIWKNGARQILPLAGR